VTKPKPKPRKHIYIWQHYLWYSEVLELRKAHLLRMEAIKKGRSDMILEVEEHWMEVTDLSKLKDKLGKELVKTAVLAGPIWDWLTDIKGLGTGLLAAQLVAQIDDIENFDSISKLWRFAGYAVFDGKAEPRGSFKAPHDEKSGRHYNGRLKGILFNIAGAFIKTQSPYYVDIYYTEKARQKELNPTPICRKCGAGGIIKVNSNGQRSYKCPESSAAGHVIDFTKQHLHYRAIRKMMNTFLKDLWLEWRRLENLPITEEWKG
jgi:hypothetical protein